jgi:hypothetical protein
MPFAFHDRLTSEKSMELLAQKYFKQDIVVACPATTSRRARPRDRKNLSRL